MKMLGEGNDGWTENKGCCPVEEDVRVDVKINYLHRPINDGCPAHCWSWGIEYEITHWRLHKEENQSEKCLEEFKGLENAYDNLEGSPMPAELFTPEIPKVNPYITPKTAYVPPENIRVKRSKHSIVAEVYELITGKSLTEDDVSDIVNVLKLIEGMEK